MMCVPAPLCRSRGFGLLEIILVIAVVLGASVGVFTVYRSAQNQADANSIVEGMSLVATNVKAQLDANAGSHWHGADVYNAISTPSNNLATIQKLYVTAGIVPPAMMVTTPGCPHSSSPFPIGMLSSDACLWVFLQSNAVDAHGNLLSGVPWIDVMVSQVSDDECNLILPRLYKAFPYDGMAHVVLDGNISLTSAAQVYNNGNAPACSAGASNNHEVVVIVVP